MVLNDTTISIVIPLYNSEANIGPLIEDLVLALRDDIKNFEIILVNDGSTDQTHMSVLKAQTQYKPFVKYIRLAKNFGEHNAVLCGLRHSIGEIVVIIDDDLQNPSSEILPLVKNFRKASMLFTANMTKNITLGFEM